MIKEVITRLRIIIIGQVETIKKKFEADIQKNRLHCTV